MKCPTCAKWGKIRPPNDYDLNKWEKGIYSFKSYAFYCGHYRTIRKVKE